MASKDAPLDQDITRLSDTTTSFEASQSQQLDTSAIQRLIEHHNQKRKQRKATIEKAHKKRVEKAETRIREDTATAQQRHEETVRAIRQPKVQQLLALMRKKHDLQQKIYACHQPIETASLSTAQKFQVAIDTRMDLIGYD